MDRLTLSAALRAYSPADPVETGHRDRMLGLLAAAGAADAPFAPFDKDHFVPGHPHLALAHRQRHVLDLCP